MPKYFHFWSDDNEVIFNGKLESRRCEFTLANGNQCKRNCIIGLPYCHTHLTSKYKIQIRDSLIPGAGKGLFAYDKKSDDDAIIFRNEDKICPYFGEIINNNELNARYGEYTAPYGMKLNNGLYEDGALERGVGTLINHRPNAQANTRFSLSNQTNRVWIKATKNIRNNQELYVSYGRDYRFNEPVHSTTNNRKYY